MAAKPTGMPSLPISGLPPVMKASNGPIRASTQDFVPIADITDDMIIFRDGGASMILESTSLNFGLLSEKEQEAIIAAYAALINSFTFAVQICVRSQKKDITSYIEYLDHAYQKIENPKLKGLMVDYRRFVEETIKKKNVLSKKFYIVVPFSNLELGVQKSFLASTTKGSLPFTKDDIIKKARVTLIPKRDHVMRQASRLGLKLKHLKTPQLIELAYEVYNPLMQEQGIRVTQQPGQAPQGNTPQQVRAAESTQSQAPAKIQ